MCTSNYIFKSDYLFLSQIKNPISREFLIIQKRDGEILGLENTSPKPKSDLAIHQILNIGCQSAYRFGASKLTLCKKILCCSYFLFLFFNQS